MTVTLKKWILVGHRWAGLTVGLAAAFLALTGLTMAFRTQLEPQVDARFLDRPACEARLPLDTLVAKARPRIRKRLLPDRDLRPAHLRHDRALRRSRRDLPRQLQRGSPGAAQPLGGFFAFMEMVHKLRFITEDGEVTEWIGGTLAILVAVMATGGLVLAWPASKRALRMILRPRLTPGTRAFDCCCIAPSACTSSSWSSRRWPARSRSPSVGGARPSMP
jgi:vanillate O-demethylase ferredoxin subunit